MGCGKFGNYFCKSCVSSIKIIHASDTICPVCEKPALDGATHPRCKTKYSIDGLTSLFRYDGVIRKAIKAIKYRYVSDLAKEFVELIPYSSFEVTTLLRSQITCFVPIPLHWARLRDRGFNQAELVGKLIDWRLHIPMYLDILKRTKVTIPQVAMKTRDARLKNMDGVFVINNDALTHGSRFDRDGHIDTVLLFDDVFTTGATMRAAAHVLKRAGVDWVWGITMAR